MKKSAGLLLYREKQNELEVLLVHPGGPFWKHKDEGAWTIPKGELSEGEKPLDAAIREFEEETGVRIKGSFRELVPIRQKSGKMVFAFSIKMDIDVTTFQSNQVKIEWPYKSGKFILIPEIDKAEWFALSEAKEKILASQGALLEELAGSFG